MINCFIELYPDAATFLDPYGRPRFCAADQMKAIALGGINMTPDTCKLIVIKPIRLVAMID